ncbi:hypothetical protein ACS0TY_013171 [Phlomoides rotata]
MPIKVIPKGELSMEDFKKWLSKFDKDGDGQINVAELREAIRATGGWFSKMQANRVLEAIETKSIKISDNEQISKLIVFALKRFGLKIVF